MQRVTLMKRFVCFSLIGAALSITLPARAQDVTHRTIPDKWIEPLLPEKLSKLDYPGYANPLDHARLEAFTGRYKLSLQTLRKADASKADPVEVALIRAASLAATGARDEAMKALSEPAVASHPRVQVRRAQVLSDQGKLQ